MQAADIRLVKDAYAGWITGDLTSFIDLFDPDIEFAVPAAESATSFLGIGRGKQELGSRLEKFLKAYDVVSYEVLRVCYKGEAIEGVVAYHYRDKVRKLAIDGTQRHQWKVSRGRIVRFQVIHDARRMGAFFELAEVERAGIDAAARTQMIRHGALI